MTDLTRRAVLSLAAASAVPLVATGVAAGASVGEPLLPDEGYFFVVKRHDEWFLLDHESKLYGPYETDMDAIHAS